MPETVQLNPNPERVTATSIQLEHSDGTQLHVLRTPELVVVLTPECLASMIQNWRLRENYLEGDLFVHVSVEALTNTFPDLRVAERPIVSA